jgi:hypothetical protein
MISRASARVRPGTELDRCGVMWRARTECWRRTVIARLLSVAGALACFSTFGSARAERPDLFARPMGGWSGGGYAASGPIGGPLLAVEGGWSALLPAAGLPGSSSPTFAARAGWQFPNGIALHLRYDDLGVRPDPSASPLQVATVGLRYSVPFFIPLPFAEVDAGSAFVGGDPRFGASAGLGVSVPLESHVLVDAVGRDWLIPISGELRQTLTASFGLTVTFASPSH